MRFVLSELKRIPDTVIIVSAIEISQSALWQPHPLRHPSVLHIYWSIASFTERKVLTRSQRGVSVLMCSSMNSMI